MASPIRDGKNELCGVVLVFRDITEKHRADAERRKAETLEQLGLLAGGIAHDFNNLLTAVIGNIPLATLLLPPNDEMIERLDNARNASLRARDLAHQLLAFSRGGAPIKKAACIASLIKETVSFSLRGSQSRSVAAIAPNLWSTEFDPGQISQVIANLVSTPNKPCPTAARSTLIATIFLARRRQRGRFPIWPPGITSAFGCAMKALAFRNNA